MYCTFLNETHNPQRVFKPFHAVSILAKHACELRNMGFDFGAEITDNPELTYKKYYFGCIKGNEKLIIKRLGGAGDVIWTLPVAREFKRRFPKMKIAYWVQDKDVQLLENNPFIDDKIGNGKINKNFISKYDYILDYYESIERYHPADFEEAYDMHWKWAFNENPSAGLLGNIFLSGKEIQHVKDTFNYKYILISLNSSNPNRTYFYMPALIDRILKEYPEHHIIITGQGGYPIESIPRVENLTNKTSFREILALINCSDLVVCTDSGNTHFAGQLGVPCVAIFSTVKSTQRAKYYPLQKSIDTKEWCSPCNKLGEYCPKNGECLSRISPDSVMKKIKECL